MFYRIVVDLAFHDEDPGEDVYDKALDHFDDAFVINPDQPNEERGFILLQKCYHDEVPGKPCDTIKHKSL